jgi:hypothetical protein
MYINCVERILHNVSKELPSMSKINKVSKKFLAKANNASFDFSSQLADAICNGDETVSIEVGDAEIIEQMVCMFLVQNKKA